MIIYLEGTIGFGMSTILHPITGYEAAYKNPDEKVEEGKPRDTYVKQRPPLFTNDHYLLMLDQPIGTGFSVVSGSDMAFNES